MGKSSTHLEGPHLPLEQEAGRAALVLQPLAAVGEAAITVDREAVARDLLEAALPFDGATAPHQPVVTCLEGLCVGADRQCA